MYDDRCSFSPCTRRGSPRVRLHHADHAAAVLHQRARPLRDDRSRRDRRRRVRHRDVHLRVHARTDGRRRPARVGGRPLRQAPRSALFARSRRDRLHAVPAGRLERLVRPRTRATGGRGDGGRADESLTRRSDPAGGTRANHIGKANAASFATSILGSLSAGALYEAFGFTPVFAVIVVLTTVA